jgi:hypothetical protein
VVLAKSLRDRCCSLSPPLVSRFLVTDKSVARRCGHHIDSGDLGHSRIQGSLTFGQTARLVTVAHETGSAQPG